MTGWRESNPSFSGLPPITAAPEPMKYGIGFAFLAATLPHVAYHLTTTDHLSATDNTASLGSFLLELIVVVGAMIAVTRQPEGRLDVATEAG